MVSSTYLDKTAVALAKRFPRPVLVICLLRARELPILAFVRILITAGPTREPIDPVRYLTNRSSGKMGYALADAFASHRHQVTLISGPTELDVPPGVDFIRITTAAEMHCAVRDFIARMDIAIFAAAVADYTPTHPSLQKIKKSGETISLELTRTADSLAAARRDFGFAGTLVGFAAETEDLIANARQKLTAKQCDLVIANDVSNPEIGFESDRNEVTLVFPTHEFSLPAAEKRELADHLVAEICDLHRAKHLSDE